jgi:aspartyl/glutamyl-tRNA(Asn/Gln) amidotransferase B subunit
MATVAKIGLEAHVQLKSQRKLFSPAQWAWDAAPNTCVDPFDLGTTGTYPIVPCTDAVLLAVRAARVLNCRLNRRSSFDRKHYWAADLPAGFQITQHRLPLACEGVIHLPGSEVGHRGMSSLKAFDALGIRQVHLEQDSARRTPSNELDFNRSGVPLVEVVTDVIEGADDSSIVGAAVAFARHIASVLTNAGVTAGVMAHGNVRFDANVSIGTGARTEIKNLASFDTLSRALAAEIARQRQSNSAIEPQTLYFDADANQTCTSRVKESRTEYMYVPEPDLPDLIIDDALLLQEQSTRPLSAQEATVQYGINLSDSQALIKAGFLHLLPLALQNNDVDVNKVVHFLLRVYPSIASRLPKTAASHVLDVAIQYARGSASVSDCKALLSASACSSNSSTDLHGFDLEEGQRSMTSDATSTRRQFALSAGDVAAIDAKMALNKGADYYMSTVLKRYAGQAIDPRAVKDAIAAYLTKQRY